MMAHRELNDEKDIETIGIITIFLEQLFLGFRSYCTGARYSGILESMKKLFSKYFFH